MIHLSRILLNIKLHNYMQRNIQSLLYKKYHIQAR